MAYFIDVMIIGLGAALINNFIFYYFVGICSFIGVSRRIGMAFGMGCSVTFVVVIASFMGWFMTTFVLVPGAPVTYFIAKIFVGAEIAAKIDLTILSYLVYIFAIAGSVQFVEMYLRKFFPPLYHALGVYLPLITTNCAILFACLIIMARIVGAEDPWDLGRALALGFGSGFGFTIAIVIMAGIREEIDLCDIPSPFKGAAITMVIAGILALAFMGFTGVDKGISTALTAKETIVIEAPNNTGVINNEVSQASVK